MPYYLRTTDKDGKSRGGFQWPLEVGATVTAPDWKLSAECGNGLHGLLDGLGESDHLSFAPDAIWWIVEADDAVDISGKWKFQACKVVAFGPRHEVTATLHALRPGPIHGACITAGDRGTATAGHNGTATAGDYGTATAGHNGTDTAGRNGTAKAGDYGTATAGEYGTLIFLQWVNDRRRVLAAYVGENGIQPNVAYRASDDFTQVIPA